MHYPVITRFLGNAVLTTIETTNCMFNGVTCFTRCFRADAAAAFPSCINNFYQALCVRICFHQCQPRDDGVSNGIAKRELGEEFGDRRESEVPVVEGRGVEGRGVVGGGVEGRG